MSNTRFQGCTLAILGDSYSTFAGHIPAGYDTYYPNEGLGVTDVSQTWWQQVIARNSMRLVMNDSWSGSTVCTNVRPEHPARAAFVARMESTLNGTTQPDLIIVFGGTNDSWTNCTIGEPQLSGWTPEGDKAVLPAFCHLLTYAKAHNPAAHVLCIVNTDLDAGTTAGIIQACDLTDTHCLRLRDIDKEWGHPTALGMTQIADQVCQALEQA